jgi:hypothetical protein
MRRPSPHPSPSRSNTSAPSYHAHKKRKTGGSSAVLTLLVNPFKLARNDGHNLSRITLHKGTNKPA